MLALLHALESGTNVWMILGLTGQVFVVVQIIQDTILVLEIMGKATGLNPTMMMLSLSICIFLKYNLQVVVRVFRVRPR